MRPRCCFQTRGYSTVATATAGSWLELIWAVILNSRWMLSDGEATATLMDSRTGIHHTFHQGSEDWTMERSPEALEKLKSEILLRFVFNVWHSFSLSEAIHLKHSPCVRHLILKCNNEKLELMNASNLPGVWVIICFYVCQRSAQLMTWCQPG